LQERLARVALPPPLPYPELPEAGRLEAEPSVEPRGRAEEEPLLRAVPLVLAYPPVPDTVPEEPRPA